MRHACSATSLLFEEPENVVDRDDDRLETTSTSTDYPHHREQFFSDGTLLRQRRRSSVLTASDAGLSTQASWHSSAAAALSKDHSIHSTKYTLPAAIDWAGLVPSEIASDVDAEEEDDEEHQQQEEMKPCLVVVSPSMVDEDNLMTVLNGQKKQRNELFETEGCTSAFPHSPQVVVGFDEHGLSPVVTHFEPPTEPHKFESAIMFFLRYACGGSNWGVVTIAATLVVGVPLLSHFTATSMLVICFALCVLGFTKYVVGNAIFWYNHMRPQEEELDPDAKRKPFLARRVGQRPHKQRDGKKVWYPILTDEESKTRAFAPYGISLACYFHDLFTWALEYKVRGVCRAICCDFNIGEYSSTKATHEDIYNFIINSSMACFIDADDEGKLKTFESKIAHPDGRTIEVYKLVSELDHQNQRHIRTIIQWEKAEEGCPAHVTVLTDPTEAIHIIGLIGAIKTHVHVHWWSNAVKDLIGKWPLAELSLSVTQGFNSAAQFTVGPMFFRRDAEGGRVILAGNAFDEGIPVHSNLGEIADNSRAHRMMKACREKLKNEVARHLGALEVEAILQATIMHAIEHHCLSQSMPWRCHSHLLGAELTPFRTTMIRGCTYRTRKLLCRDFTDVDTICGAIYKCCHEIDPEFADGFLCVGAAA